MYSSTYTMKVNSDGTISHYRFVNGRRIKNVTKPQQKRIERESAKSINQIFIGFDNLFKQIGD